jgi:hypothetical protein
MYRTCDILLHLKSILHLCVLRGFGLTCRMLRISSERVGYSIGLIVISYLISCRLGDM